MASHDIVPFFVLRLDNNNNNNDENDNNATGDCLCHAKAVFTVPEDLADTLTAHPILCRGGAFELTLDQESQYIMMAQTTASTTTNTSRRRGTGTSFLSTEFYSPAPEDTASEISKRLAIRMDNADSFTVETLLGL
jgi:hypothetical protein